MLARTAFRDFRDFFRQLERIAAPVVGNTSLIPLVDLKETEKAFHLEAELPGVKKNDISLSTRGDHTLILKGYSMRETTKPTDILTEHEGKAVPAPESEKQDGQQQDYWVMEREVGQFERMFQLPRAIDQKRVRATFRDGILYCTWICQKQARKRQRIASKSKFPMNK